MKALEKLIENAPKIINEAARSRRGTACLIVLAISVVTVFLFWNASDNVRVVAFILLIGSCTFFGFLVFRQPSGAPVTQDATTVPESTESVSATRPAEDYVSIERLPMTGSEFFGREGELKRLDEAWVEPATNVISLVAWGGVGKTSLIKRWLGKMAVQHYRGA